ncbi:MAG: ABC transporter substrate-binding protein [Candidatus Dormibacteraeota bacterium]|nr:ABC transporter substrate-binding protein [Candidatus Dormibacteraeota bacterium]
MTEHRTRRWRLAAAALAALAVAACGGQSGPQAVANPNAPRPASMTQVTLVLDFVPNAVHAGIYRALASGYYRRENIDLKVIQPTSTADTLKLIDAGKADFGLADGIDVAEQIDLGRDAKAIMALAQRPLGGLITLQSEGLTSARQLEGKTVGITGVPSDAAVLDTIVAGAGGAPSRVHTVTIGFNGVQDLENQKVAAFTGFWPADGVQLQVSGFPINSFKLDENGGPAYPGLVVFSTRQRIDQDPPLMRAFVAATVHGYRDTLADPQASLKDLLDENPSLQRTFTTASLQAYLPLFQADAPAFGVLRADRVQQLSSWLLRHRLIKHAISPSRYGTDQFLPAS